MEYYFHSHTHIMVIHVIIFITISITIFRLHNYYPTCHLDVFNFNRVNHNRVALKVVAFDYFTIQSLSFIDHNYYFRSFVVTYYCVGSRMDPIAIVISIEVDLVDKESFINITEVVANHYHDSDMDRHCCHVT